MSESAAATLLPRIGAATVTTARTTRTRRKIIIISSSSSSSYHPVKLTTPRLVVAAAGSSRSYDAGHAAQPRQQQQQLGGGGGRGGRSGKSPRRLITISTGSGRWNGEWSCDYLFSFRDLGLQDLVQDGVEQRDATVSVKLCVEKHASFGFSVDGTIVTTFTKKCICCNAPYSTQIDTSVNVWVLPSSRQKHDRGAMDEFPVIGGDDPSVIYVKPGHEADLDSLVQDAVRLAISVKDTTDTCSERCEEKQPKLHYVGKQNPVGVDKRWARLLQLKNQTSTRKV